MRTPKRGFVTLLALALLIPYGLEAGYGQSAYYSQSIYYSQGTYYSQATYQTTFTLSTVAATDFSVTNAISKGSGTFVIDHPLDPKNKLLFHFFVESPDVKNVYDGITIMNEDGEAVITLPEYFMALNKDFRYQVKPITAAMPDLHVQEEIVNNQFKIGGGKPGGKVSWQVTGIRHDPLIQANPVVVEVEKGLDTIVQKGDLLYEFGRPLFPFEELVRQALGR